MPKTIAYVRVSTDKQDAESQLTGIRAYAIRSGIIIDEVLAETVSGFKVDLKERKLSDILAELATGDTLIVSETSRISRRLLDVLNTIQGLIERGINVITVKEGIEFKDDINSKVLAFAFGLSAEIERSLISARTKEGLARKRAEGVVLGRPVGSGKPEHYKLHGKDEEILELLSKRVSKSAIARIFGVHRETLTRYMRRQELDKEAFWRRMKTGVNNK